MSLELAPPSCRRGSMATRTSHRSAGQQAITRTPTSIRGLDALPSSGPGTGKTLLGIELLAHRAMAPLGRIQVLSYPEPAQLDPDAQLPDHRQKHPGRELRGGPCRIEPRPTHPRAAAARPGSLCAATRQTRAGPKRISSACASLTLRRVHHRNRRCGAGSASGPGPGEL